MAFLQLENVKTHFPIKKGLLFPKEVDIVKAVDGITLEIEKGEILGLVGESGCGKSTLSRTIMQLVKATGGKIFLDGEELTSQSPGLIRGKRLDFQMIFQDPYASLNPRMTVYSTLAEAICQRHPKLKGNKPELSKAISELMERVGLDRRFMKKYPHEFSGGQRQRIAIARALINELDVSIQSQILNLLLELRKDLNLTMIFISHDLSVVRYIADNIAVMYSGELVEYGEADTVFTSPKHSYTKKLLEAIPQILTETNS